MINITNRKIKIIGENGYTVTVYPEFAKTITRVKALLDNARNYPELYDYKSETFYVNKIAFAANKYYYYGPAEISGFFKNSKVVLGVFLGNEIFPKITITT